MKIFAIGMNYALHNKELHGTLLKTEQPVIFLKPDTALLRPGKPFFVPTYMGRVDYETEVIIRFSKAGKNIDPRFAQRYYDAISLGFDFTARDMQAQFKKQGRPWDISKGFDQSAVIGEWVAKEELPDIQKLHFNMRKHGQTMQEGHTADMLYTVADIIAYISKFYTIHTGDILYTGTPSGIGPVEPGDKLTATLEGKEVLALQCK